MKIKSLIAALALFAAAGTMTACQKKNKNNAQPVVEKTANKSTGAPEQQDTKEDKQPEVDPAVVKALELRGSLSAMALSKKGESCTVDNYGLTGQHVDMFKDSVEAILNTKTGEEKFGVSLGYVKFLLTSQVAKSDSYCVVSAASAISKKAIAVYIDSQNAGFYTSNDNEQYKVRSTQIAEVLSPLFDKHMKLISASETRQAWKDLANENDILVNET